METHVSLQFIKVVKNQINFYCTFKEKFEDTKMVINEKT